MSRPRGGALAKATTAARTHRRDTFIPPQTILRITVFIAAVAPLGPVPITLGQEAPSYWIIVNEANETPGLLIDEVSELFLGKRTTWPDGSEVQPVDLGPDSPAREAFSGEVHRRTTANVKRYWQRQLFSGLAAPPAEMSSDSAVVAFVRERPGAVGYVSQSATLDGTKVLPVVSGPNCVHYVEPGYTLMARRLRIEGDVILRVTLGENGEVIGAAPIQGLPHGLTDEAVRAVQQWRYRPTVFNGKAVKLSFELTIRFRLASDPPR